MIIQEDFEITMRINMNEKYKNLSDKYYRHIMKDFRNIQDIEKNELQDLAKYLINRTIIELDILKKSKISIKDYSQTIKALKNAQEKIQPYSSSKINLDKLPNHPSIIYHDFFFYLNLQYGIDETILKRYFSNLFSAIIGYGYTKIKKTQEVKKTQEILISFYHLFEHIS